MSLPIFSVPDPTNILTGPYSLQFSICSAIILIATFVPKGSFAFNPQAIEGVCNEQELWEDDSSEGSIKSDIERARSKTDESGFVPS